MHFDIWDVQVQTFLLRILHSLFILGVSIILHWCAAEVDNTWLKRAFWRSALFAGVFFLARIAAGLADGYFTFNVGWFSNLVNVIFWSIILGKVWGLYRILSSPKNNDERVAIREALNEIEQKLVSARRNLQSLQ